MKHWLRKFLGFEDISLHMQVNNKRLGEINYTLGQLNLNISIYNRALGRIVAKLDPIFAIPEDDPKRKAESDALGEAVINKLKGEHEASNRWLR